MASAAADTQGGSCALRGHGTARCSASKACRQSRRHAWVAAASVREREARHVVDARVLHNRLDLRRVKARLVVLLGGRAVGLRVGARVEPTMRATLAAIRSGPGPIGIATGRASGKATVMVGVISNSQNNRLRKPTRPL